MIDKLLREALDTRIVNRFLGYQGGAEVVDRQVYALWNVLQKRKFRYSSVSNTSLSSNVVFSQRVRTFDDALESSQINCVDGSVLFCFSAPCHQHRTYIGAHPGAYVCRILHGFQS